MRAEALESEGGINARPPGYSRHYSALCELTDREWVSIRHLTGGGTPQADAIMRCSVDAILWRMRTGEPWRFIPNQYGVALSIRRRFKKWEASGVWREITSILAELRATSPRSSTSLDPR